MMAARQAQGDKGGFMLDKLNEMFITFYRKVGITEAFDVLKGYVSKGNNEAVKQRAIEIVCIEYDIDRSRMFNGSGHDMAAREARMTLFLSLKKLIPTYSVGNFMDTSGMKYNRCYITIKAVEKLDSSLAPDRKIIERAERIKTTIEDHIKGQKNKK